MAVLPQKDKEFRLERLKFKLLADEKVVEQLTSFERLAVNQDFKVFLEALKSAFDKKITDYDTGKKVFFSSSSKSFSSSSVLYLLYHVLILFIFDFFLIR